MGNDSGSASYALRRLASPSASYARRRGGTPPPPRSAPPPNASSTCRGATSPPRAGTRAGSTARPRRGTRPARGTPRGRARDPIRIGSAPRVPHAPPASPRRRARAPRGSALRRPAPRPARRAHVLERAHIVSYRSPQTRAHAARLDVSGVDQKALAQIARRDAKRSARTRRRLIIAVVRLLRLIIVRVARRVLCGLRSVRSARHAETVHVHIHVLVQRVEDGLRAPAQQIAARRVRGTASVSRRFLKTRFFYAPTRAARQGPGPAGTTAAARAAWRVPRPTARGGVRPPVVHRVDASVPQRPQLGEPRAAT